MSRTAGEDSSPVLTIEALRAHIGGQQVVEDVTFSVPDKGVTALLDRNGVGKTSTIRALLGLISRTGRIELAGERIDGEPTHRIVQRGVGYVPEDRDVFSKLTVAENLQLRRTRTAFARAERPRRVALPRPSPARPAARGHAFGRPAADGRPRPRAAE